MVSTFNEESITRRYWCLSYDDMQSEDRTDECDRENHDDERVTRVACQWPFRPDDTRCGICESHATRFVLVGNDNSHVVFGQRVQSHAARVSLFNLHLETRCIVCVELQHGRVRAACTCSSGAERTHGCFLGRLVFCCAPAYQRADAAWRRW